MKIVVFIFSWEVCNNAKVRYSGLNLYKSRKENLNLYLLASSGNFNNFRFNDKTIKYDISKF